MENSLQGQKKGKCGVSAKTLQWILWRSVLMNTVMEGVVIVLTA